MIRHDWFLSFRASSRVGQLVRKDIYDHGQNALIDLLLETCPPIVATLESVPDEALGWVCRELTRPVTHMVYVKHAYRRNGIAGILAANSKFYTHQTPAGDRLFKRLGALFNPYLLQGVPCPILPA